MKRNTLPPQAQAFLQKAEGKYSSPYEVEQDVECCGTCFPMKAQYEKREERGILGIKGTVSMDGLCGEVCFFDFCECLNAQTLQDYAALFRRVQDTQVPAQDPDHVYTLMSFVLCVNRVEKEAVRALKRLNDYRDYRDGAYGWSALRVCVVDLSDETYYCNKMGKGVKECLTRDHLPEKRKRLFGIF